MKNLMVLGLITFTIFSSALSFGQEVQEIHEKDLWSYASSKSPEFLRLTSQALENEVAFSELKDRYAPEAFGMAMYRRTNEEPFIAFNPVVSPQSVFEAGVRKKFNVGITGKASVGLDNRNFQFNGSTQTPSIATARIGFTMDLWKNFLGRLDRAELQALEANQQQSYLYQSIGQHAFWINLRSIYWNLIMLDEQIELAQKMYEHAQQQEKVVRKQYQEQASDMAELSLYQSQTSSRQNEVLHLKFQREQQIQRLASMVPAFSEKNIKIVPESAEIVRGKVLGCIATIQGFQSLPKDTTQYDEILEQVSAHRKAQLTQARSYSEVDVNLSGDVFSTAVDPEIAPAFGEVFGEKRQGFQVQLNVSVPLGKKDTEKKKLHLVTQQQEKDESEIRLMMQSSFDFIKKSIPLLITSIEAQKRDIDSLVVRTREVKKKYNQGRISIGDYISDQDRLLQSELALRSSQNIVIQTLLQYLSVYGQTDCDFNKVQS
ncbi:MAG: TolC family protein [Bdellovibrionota bacterium]